MNKKGLINMFVIEASGEYQNGKQTRQLRNE